MREKLNYVLLACLGGYNSRFNDLSMLIKKDETDVSEKLTNTMQTIKEFGYIGEFFERHNEVGFTFNETEYATLGLFYGLYKSIFTESDFNDYQITNFMTELNAIYEKSDNTFIDFALYLINEDSKYLEQCAKKISSLEELSWLLKVFHHYRAMKDANILLNETEELFLSTKIFNSTPMYLFKKCIDYSRSVKSTTNKFAAGWVKSIDSKLPNVIAKEYNKIGLSNLEIECITCVLRWRFNVGAKKNETTLIKTLIDLAKKTSSYTEIEENVLNEILSKNSKFDVKLEGGLVLSLSNAISYYNILKDIALVENWLKIVKIGLENKIIDVNDIFIDMLNDADYETKLSLLAERDVTSNWLKNIVKVQDKDNELIAVNLLIAKYEKYINLNNTETETKKTFRSAMDSGSSYLLKVPYAMFCRLGITNPLMDYEEKKVDIITTKNYYQFCNNHDRYLIVKYLYEKECPTREKALSLSNLELVGHCKTKSQGTHFLLEDTSKEEMKEYLSMLGEILLTTSLDYFTNFTFNILSNENEIKELFSESEINELYTISLKLASRLKNKTSYYNWSNENSRELLIRMYMSRAEKDEIARKEKEAKEEKTRQEKLELEASAKDAITTYLSENTKHFNDDWEKIRDLRYYLSREVLRTDVYKQYIISIYKSKDLKICKENMSVFLESLGDFIENDKLSLDEVKSIVNGLKISSPKKEEVA